jgi:phosphate transport system ATP-binding protein
MNGSDEEQVAFSNMNSNYDDPDTDLVRPEQIDDPVLETKDLNVFYGDNQAIDDVSLKFPKQNITAIIGPSGCGKSTLLRSLNRMNDFVSGTRTEGTVSYRGIDVYRDDVDPMEIRHRISMVFQKPNPFPKSIYKNISWAPSIHGYDGEVDELVETCLKQAALWDEVKNRLNDSALALSGGQQQRLCIARAIAIDPQVVLMDEPCSALDPTATSRIEDLIHELKDDYTIVIVTHNMQQAARVSDYTAFLYKGELIEWARTDELFTNPEKEMTQDYITGRFG